MVSYDVEQREGVYYVPGTRITLDSIVYASREGCSPESIREDFEGLTLPDVYGAIAYYLDHKKMRDAAFTPKDEKNPTPIEAALLDMKTTFRQLQADRHRADYDLSWNIVATDAQNAITLAEDAFTKWRSIRVEDVARHYLLSMFGANR